MKLILNPRISLGKFFLDKEINDYLMKYDLKFKKCPEDDITGWDTYELDNPEMSIYTENGIIVSISSEKEFIYKNKNIIGLNYNEVLKIIGTSPSEVNKYYIADNNDYQYVYDFDNLSIQLWTFNDIVVNAFLLSNKE